MTRLLVVAYFFPPRGGAGTQRFAKFCKYLPAHGVEPTVLTSGEIGPTRHAPHDDPTLTPGDLVVERVDAPRRARFARRLQRALRLHLDEDEWVDAALPRALELARRHDVEALITSLSPYACFRIGERLQRELAVPWLLDLRDPWALDGWRSYRSRLHAAVDMSRMRRALTSADWVIANTPEAAQAYLGLGARAERTVVIPNGFDGADFAALAPPTWAADGRFHLVFVGTFLALDADEGLTANRLLRVRHRQLELLGRTGYYLLHALARLRERAPERAAKLHVHCYGSVDGSHRALIDRLGIGDLITLHGYVSHRESVDALGSADAAFVPLHGVPAGERALIVPGKLYEALASGAPVLAALPPGDGADLVRALDAGLVVPPTDAAALGEALERLLTAWSDGAAIRGCAAERVSPFTRRALTASLARVVQAAVRRAAGVDVVDPWRAVLAEQGPPTSEG